MGRIYIEESQFVDSEGWSRWIAPHPEFYRMSCCDCGLVHDMQFRVAEDAAPEAQFRIRRNNRATAAVRRERKKRGK